LTRQEYGKANGKDPQVNAFLLRQQSKVVKPQEAGKQHEVQCKPKAVGPTDRTMTKPVKGDELFTLELVLRAQPSSMQRDRPLFIGR
jgi:hypothetical protein